MTFKPCNPWPGRTDKRGYGRVKYGPPGKRRDVLVHRLAYCEANGLTLEEIDGQVVRHSCDYPRCREPEHLQLGTQAENMQDMADKQRSTIGSRNPNRKTTEAEVLEIRKLRKAGATLQALSRAFLLNEPSISMICNRRTWNHV